MPKGICASALAVAGAACVSSQSGFPPLFETEMDDSLKTPLVDDGQWKQVFAEEFESSRLDRKTWTTCYWWNDNGCTNQGNNELQWYKPKNVQVLNGYLQLTARPEKVTGIDNRTFSYTSGMVTTGRDYSERPRRSRVGFLYGHFEIRAKVPTGQGLWPALWLLPEDRESKPEIDIMEVLGHTPNMLRMHFHYIDEGGRKRSVGKTTGVSDLSKDWHVYGMRWEPGVITWYLDGVEQWQLALARHTPKERMYLLMNLAVGGDWPGAPGPATKFPAEYLIDYVRVWQRVD